MLTKLTPTKLTQKCSGLKIDATKCLQINEIPMSSVELGVSSTRFKDKNQIKFPACSNCGGFESVIRDWNVVPASHPGYKLKCAVNFLSKELKRLGQINSGCALDIAAEMSDPPSILSDYPPGDGTI